VCAFAPVRHVCGLPCLHMRGRAPSVRAAALSSWCRSSAQPVHTCAITRAQRGHRLVCCAVPARNYKSHEIRLRTVRPTAQLPCFTASIAYSTWNRRPCGLHVVTSVSYCGSRCAASAAHDRHLQPSAATLKGPWPREAAQIAPRPLVRTENRFQAEPDCETLFLARCLTILFAKGRLARSLLRMRRVRSRLAEEGLQQWEK
jgi:hypothetical protein